VTVSKGTTVGDGEALAVGVGSGTTKSERLAGTVGLGVALGGGGVAVGAGAVTVSERIAVLSLVVGDVLIVTVLSGAGRHATLSIKSNNRVTWLIGRICE